jgi:tetratricopeptide (TPR) repeat protein
MSEQSRSRTVLRGSLLEESLPDVMRQIYTERRTGELLLINDVTRRRVFFETGRAIFASSNRKGDRLGEFMLRRGEISQTTFDLATSSLTRGRRFGRMLVEMNIITEEQLAKAVQEQILSIIYSLFEWTTGEFEFVERAATNVPVDLRLNLSMADIILEGVRRIRDFAVVRRGLGDLNRLIAPATDPLLRLQRASLKPQEQELLKRITEPTDLLSLLVFSQQPAAATIRALYGLASAGFLAYLPPPVVSQDTGFMTVTVVEEAVEPAPQPALNATKELSASNDANDAAEEALRREIEEIRARIDSDDPFTVLGVSREATVENLRSAYYEMSRRFHPDRFRQASKALREEVEQIFPHLTDAYHRARAGMQYADGMSSSISGVMAGAIDMGAGKVMEPQIDEAQKRLLAEAEQSYNTGLTHLVANRYHAAAEALSKAARLEPENAKYHASLALALSKNAQRAKEAEQHFLQAIELDPNNAQHHALLGSLYTRLGLARRAESVYRQALKLDPQNAVALKGLAAQRIDDSLLTRLFTRK